MNGERSDEDELKRLVGSIEASPIAAVVTDSRLPDNPNVAVNGAFTALTGYARDEALGRNCRFLAGEATDPAAQQVLRDAVAHCRSALAELVNYRKDGSVFLNAVMIAPVLGEDGEARYFLGSQMGVERPQAGWRRARAAQLVEALTPRQRQVLAGLVAGCRNKQIAGRLGIDEKTVKMHRAALLERLGATSTADAIRIGVEAGLAG